MASESPNSLEAMNRQLNELQAYSEHMKRVLTALRRVNQILLSSEDPLVLIQNICNALTGKLGYLNAWIALVDEHQHLLGAASSFEPDVFNRILQPMQSGHWPVCAGTALHQREMVTIDDPKTTCLHCPLAIDYPDQGAICCPIIHEDRTFGILTASVPRNYSENAEQHELILELCNDIAQRLHHLETDLQLRNSRHTMGFAQQLGKLGTWQIDLRTGKVSGSDTSRIIYGFEHDTPLSIELIQSIPLPEERPRLDEAFRRLVENGEPYDIQFHFRRVNDGAIRFAHSLATYEKAHKLVIGTIQDITNQVETEALIRENETYLKTILQTTGDGFFVTDTSGRFVDFNEAYCQMVGYTREELATRTLSDIDAFENPEDVQRHMQQVIARGSELFETTHLRKGGSPIRVEISVNWLAQRSGRFVCFCRDLTRRRKQDQKIHALGQMLDAAPVAIWVIDFDGHPLWANRLTSILHGYEDHQAFLQLSLRDLDTPASQAMIEPRLKAIRDHGEARFEVEHFHRDGHIIPLEVIAKAINWEGKDAFMSIATDIQQRKQWENALISSEERNRLLSEMTTEGILLHKNGRPIDMNAAFERLIGIERSDLLDTNMINFVHPDDLPQVHENMSKSIAGPYTIRMRLASGNYAFVEVESRDFPVGDDTWRATAVRDLTDRRKAERALRESEAKHRRLIQHLHAGVVIHAPDTTIRFANEQACSLLGLSLDQLMGRASIDPRWCFLRKDGRPMPTEEFPVNQIVRSGAPIKNFIAGIQHTNPDSVAWVMVNAFPDQDDSGKLHQIVVTFTDITALLKAEKALSQSRDLMQYIIEHANGGVAVHDRQLRYIFVSQQYVRNYNLESTRVLGRHHYDVFPDLPDKWKLVHQRALAGEVISHEADPFTGPDGSTEWTRWECRPWYQAPGEVGGIIVYTEMITERMRAQEALKASETFQRAIVSSSPLAIIVTDLDSRIVDWNEAATRIFGWERDEVIGKKPPYLGKGQKTICETTRADLIAGGTVPQIETTRYHRSGRPVELSITTAPIRDHEGQVVRIMAIMEDITEKKRLRDQEQGMMEALRIEKDAAESANRAKDEFLAVMSHELRTPLNAVMGFTQLLQEESDNPDTLDYLASIMQAGEQQLQLIDNILNYARLDRANITPTLTSTELHLLCESTLSEFEPLAHGLQLSMHNGCDGFGPVPTQIQVVCDSSMLRRLLQNLINNAIKYTRDGFVSISIGRRRENEAASCFRFEVRDSGVGIAPDKIGRLFLPFSQVDSSYSRHFDGAGLGLAICKKIVDMLGGTIGVQSEPGKGSCFWFELNLREEPKNTTEAPPIIKATATPKLPNSLHILVVDDRTDNRLLCQSFIQRLGGTSILADSGPMALEHASRERFDVIFMDLSMPGMDGFTATRVLRSSPGPNQQTPVIAITADTTELGAQQCKLAGMHTRITKPVRLRSLFDVLHPLSLQKPVHPPNNAS
jgi:PAS domain S-box-containing protein